MSAQRKAKAAEPGSRTAYVILRAAVHTSPAFIAVDERAATSAVAAVRAHIAEFAEPGITGLFVAVPRVSWRVLEYTVKVVETTALVPYEAPVDDTPTTMGYSPSDFEAKPETPEGPNCTCGHAVSAHAGPDNDHPCGALGCPCENYFPDVKVRA